MVAVSVTFPLVAPNRYIVHLGVMACIWAILAVSLNVLAGYVGLLSLGHAAFFGVGAYASALAALRWSLPIPLATVLAGGVTGTVGLLLAIPALRVRGVYFSAITLAFGLITHLLFVNLNSLTGGAQGIFGIPRPTLLGTALLEPRQYYFYALFWLAVTLVVAGRLLRSPLGRFFIALREDEIAASCAGVDTRRVKLAAFFLSSVLAGVAGSLYGHYVRYINPDAFTTGVSITVLVMVVVGGLGNIAGSIVGAGLVSLLPEVLRFAQVYYYAAFGAILVAMTIFAPEGIVALVERVVGRLRYSYRGSSVADEPSTGGEHAR